MKTLIMLVVSAVLGLSAFAVIWKKYGSDCMP